MVRSHRCPATVSGSKSAETTEVSCLGKVQRVGQCREPGDLPCLALRRPFEGKGRRFLCVDPNQADWGFLCGLPPSLLAGAVSLLGYTLQASGAGPAPKALWANAEAQGDDAVFLRTHGLRFCEGEHADGPLQ